MQEVSRGRGRLNKNTGGEGVVVHVRPHFAGLLGNSN